jgi:hypothetical protein
VSAVITNSYLPSSAPPTSNSDSVHGPRGHGSSAAPAPAPSPAPSPAPARRQANVAGPDRETLPPAPAEPACAGGAGSGTGASHSPGRECEQAACPCPCPCPALLPTSACALSRSSLAEKDTLLPRVTQCTRRLRPAAWRASPSGSMSAGGENRVNRTFC